MPVLLEAHGLKKLQADLRSLMTDFREIELSEMPIACGFAATERFQLLPNND